jgi:hypothetical protein
LDNFTFATPAHWAVWGDVWKFNPGKETDMNPYISCFYMEYEVFQDEISGDFYSPGDVLVCTIGEDFDRNLHCGGCPIFKEEAKDYEHMYCVYYDACIDRGCPCALDRHWVRVQSIYDDMAKELKEEAVYLDEYEAACAAEEAREAELDRYLLIHRKF